MLSAPKSKPSFAIPSSENEDSKVSKGLLGRNEADFARDWGCFFAKINRRDIAIKKFDESLQYKNNAIVFYHRAMAKRMNGDTIGALKDAQYARKIDQVQKYYEEEGRDLFELNELEYAKSHMHNCVEKYKNMRVDPFKEKIVALDGVFDDCMSKQLGEYLVKNSTKINEVLEAVKSKNYVDKRPLWKIRKSDEKCDITSIIEKEEEKISFVEYERRNENFKMFAQSYMPRGWKDILLMKELKNDPNFKPSRCYKTLNEKYTKTLKFIRMLEARNPLYNKNGERYSTDTWMKMHHDFILRSRNEIRRRMYKILKNVRQLRNAGNVENLQMYIEKEMKEFVVNKSNAILPNKFSFINEIYNHLGLAYADNYIIPNNLNKLDDSKALMAMLKLKNQDPLPSEKKVFGSRTKDELSSTNLKEEFMKQMNYLDRRLLFSKFDIERCYLNYERARSLFDHGSVDESYLYTKKAFEASRLAKNTLWQFLCKIQILKVFTMKGDLTSIKSVLMDAQIMANVLNNTKLIAFVNKALTINSKLHFKKIKKIMSDSVLSRRTRSQPLFVSKQFD